MKSIKRITEKEKGAYDTDWQKEVTRELIEKTIREKLDFHTVIDIGCGKMHYFSEAIRVDGNTEADYDILFDLEEVGDFGKYDLVFSIETAEHIKNADNFVETITRCSRKWIVMTASPPSEKTEYTARAHLNEQEKDYWIKKVEAKGFKYNKELTEELQEIFKDSTTWFKRDLMIFKCE